MNSPARRHRIRHEVAASKAAAASDQLRPDLSQHELHLAQLAEHKRALKQIQSIERKVEFKRKALPEYADYVDGVLSAPAAKGQPDDVLTTVMVWRIDTGDIDGAIAIGAYVLENHIPLPDQYERNAATVLAEQVAEGALRELSGHDLSDAEISRWQQNLSVVQALVLDQDMPDQVRAKLHKAMGYAMHDTDPAEALGNLRRALELNPKVGVKKDIERLERALKNDPQPKSSQPPAETSAGAAGTPSQSRQEAD